MVDTSAGTLSHEDFFPRVERAVERGRALPFLKRWAGDRTLFLRTSKAPVIIEASCFHKTAPAENDRLEDISLIAWEARREIAFTGIIDERRRRIVAFVKGELGSYGFCDWEKGRLLKKSFALARKLNCGVMLGHTHPPLYGPVCSDINSTGERFGDDYREILERMQGSSMVSRFHIIMTPSHNLIGIFELREKGVLIYHPWRIS
ncbi:MAG: hypothetical protein Q8P49_03390 [Candidatus Liptonbacteria bacterium]|nr:hypothetical protein [Candidatus Liptonbacteria bacterium]